MKTKGLLKKGTVALLAVVFASCIDEATEFLAKKTITEDYVITNATGKQSISIQSTVDASPILDQGDVLEGLEVVEISVTLGDDFNGSASELNPTEVTLQIGDTTYSEEISLVVGQSTTFPISTAIPIQDLISNNGLTAVLTIEANEVITDTDGEFTLTLALDAQALVSGE